MRWFGEEVEVQWKCWGRHGAVQGRWLIVSQVLIDSSWIMYHQLQAAGVLRESGSSDAGCRLYTHLRHCQGQQGCMLHSIGKEGMDFEMIFEGAGGDAGNQSGHQNNGGKHVRERQGSAAVDVQARVDIVMKKF
mmetsp:Transcript_141336/g.246422  ORF Transcript_141336/g.246422 Transcript_141336/m.246422 type:complete len:134 (-) Transcript_141336:163-564(-)